MKSSIWLEPGDCLEVVARLARDGIVVDSIVCDPPYHLMPTVKRFSKPGSAPPKSNMQSPGGAPQYQRPVKGFMGQSWDGGDIAFQPETWVTLASVLRPGGFLLAFGGTRTFHRMVCAIEDAGFVIQDTIMWLYGSGFPKRRDTLKPAWEPICVAYKPNGKRTLQVDECRTETSDNDRPNSKHNIRATEPAVYAAGRFKAGELVVYDAHADGRWPANVCHDGSDEVMGAFAAFGESKSVSSSNRNGRDDGAVFALRRNEDRERGHNDSGSPARFFFCGKADGEDRFGSRHPTVKPIELIKWLVKLVTPKDGTCLDPFAGSGTTGIAAMATGRHAILIERDASYQADIRERIKHYEGEGRHSLVSKNRSKTERGAMPLFGEGENAADDVKAIRGGRVLRS